MEIEGMLMNKAGIATRQLAEMLFAFSVGEQIPPVSELSERLGTARGNVQVALVNLKKTGAISLRSRGHLGSFIEAIDYVKLAEICGKTALMGVMPLPYSKKYEGLATALYTLGNSGHIAVHIAFMRGSENRYQNLLEKRYDFCVMSQMALDYYNERRFSLACMANFGNESYVSSHALFSKKPFSKEWKGLRVGLDLSSVDQSTLTYDYFEGKEVVYVPLSYNQMLPSLESGELDVCVWNRDDFMEDRGFYMEVLENPSKDHRDTQAVIAARLDDPITSRLLAEVLDGEEVKEMQKKVESGKLLPKY